MQSDPVDSEKLVEATDRLRRGDATRAIARALGISISLVSALRREIDRESRPSSEALHPIVAELGSQHGFVAEVKFSFAFAEVGSRHRP
jgi:hypothetical protein